MNLLLQPPTLQWRHRASPPPRLQTQKSKSNFLPDPLLSPSSGYSDTQNKHLGVTLYQPLLIPSGQPHTVPLSPLSLSSVPEACSSVAAQALLLLDCYNRLLLACQTQLLLQGGLLTVLEQSVDGTVMIMPSPDSSTYRIKARVKIHPTMATVQMNRPFCSACANHEL